ncbi:hypothetical protein Hanom_Chr00s058760g01784221 [Helianthus anomalus]
MSIWGILNQVVKSFKLNKIILFIFQFISAAHKLKKTNSFLFADCRGLVNLFSYRCLQMWSADCGRFTSEKTNIT